MENNSQIIIYTTETGETKLEVRLENETVWLTQKLIAVLQNNRKAGQGFSAVHHPSQSLL